jgi:hypothetical protein
MCLESVCKADDASQSKNLSGAVLEYLEKGRIINRPLLYDGTGGPHCGQDATNATRA